MFLGTIPSDAALIDGVFRYRWEKNGKEFNWQVKNISNIWNNLKNVSFCPVAGKFTTIEYPGNPGEEHWWSPSLQRRISVSSSQTHKLWVTIIINSKYSKNVKLFVLIIERNVQFEPWLSWETIAVEHPENIFQCICFWRTSNQIKKNYF